MEQTLHYNAATGRLNKIEVERGQRTHEFNYYFESNSAAVNELHSRITAGYPSGQPGPFLRTTAWIRDRGLPAHHRNFNPGESLPWSGPNAADFAAYTFA